MKIYSETPEGAALQFLDWFSGILERVPEDIGEYLGEEDIKGWWLHACVDYPSEISARDVWEATYNYLHRN